MDYEWRTALRDGKPVYIVLFEGVELPAELREQAAAIIDMRTRFEAKVTVLVDRLAQRHDQQEKALPSDSPRKLPRLPLGALFVEAVLALVLAASLFFAYLNVRTLVAITVPQAQHLPDGSGIGFTTHLAGVVFHGLSSKVYAFLGVAGLTLILTIGSAFLLLALHYRRRFIFVMLPVTLLGSSLLYLNTSFLNHSTNHIVTSIADVGGMSIVSTPANLNSSAWRDLGDMLLGNYVDYGPMSSSLYASPFLSVGADRPYLMATSALWRWPTLFLLLLAVVALQVSLRSGSLYRWLATGNAPEALRFRHGGYSFERAMIRSGCSATQEESAVVQHDGKVESHRVSPGTSGRPPRWHLLHHPADSHIAAEIEDGPAAACMV